ncbi:MAG TPA: PSD1 and planctomycete cytochrome C domain-containing protein [Phycisphaerales bacterium]|nr:PSD1 and planctomycete cytochrome C domain-containing protein [Phycisphaerales bacterium]
MTTTLEFAETYGFWKLLAVLVGRLHLVILHFPVGLLIAAGVLETWAWWRGKGWQVRASGRGPGLDAAAGACLWLGVASVVVAVATGWVHAGQSGGSIEVEIHRWVGTGSAVVAILALLLRSAATQAEREGRAGSPVAAAYRWMVVLGALTVGVAGHFGGSVTHGSGYLSDAVKDVIRGHRVVPGMEGEGEDGKPIMTPGTGGGVRVPGDDALFVAAHTVLQERCVECHGMEKRKGGLRVDSLASLMKGGKRGASIVPGDAKSSYLMRRIRGEGPDEQMPPEGDPLTDEQVRAVEAWINAGAIWPGSGAAVPTVDGPERLHWAYVPPVKAPAPHAGEWGVNEIDGFVLAAMKRLDLSPSPQAHKGELLRRVSLDLTGLPPTVEELDAYEADTAADAYERVVERLLASPAFGERWARPWLDLARYGDSRGYEKDQTWSMWPYRDWVINALNADMPFDRFTVEQIAGDLLPEATEQQRAATAFQRLSMLNEEGGVDPEEARVTAVVDRVDTTSTVWLGATMGCARCHDHKFDPVTMKDYYGLLAYFNSTADEVKTVGDGETHVIAPSITLKGVPGAKVEVMKELETPRETRLMHRGDFRNPGGVVKPGVPPALAGAAAPPVRDDRLGLAEWIIDAGNPLTARVHVNRLWSVYFGRGLVETEDDFGTRGDEPSHPALLDWLAREFVEAGWSQKRIHRLIVTSATYRQSSVRRAGDGDPANVWLSRGPRFRLEAETIRDQALALGGLLSTRFGGPSVKPPQPPGIWGHAYSGEKWVESTGEDRYRRGLYTFVKRATPYPSMAVFDAPSRQVACARRPRSNTPLQALTTLNDPVFVEAAAGLARRTVAVPGDDAARIAWAVRACVMRRPTAGESAVLTRVLQGARQRYVGKPSDAKRLIGADGESPDKDAVELASWTVVANVLLNLDEVLCKG